MFVVITRTYFEPELKDKVLGLTSRSIPVFKKLKGFVSIRPILSTDDSHLMAILEWESEDDHHECVKSSDWDEFNAEWLALFDSGKAKYKINTYDE